MRTPPLLAGVRTAFILFLAQAGYWVWTSTLPAAMAEAGATDPEIGLIVGLATMVQMPLSFVAAGLIDRFGSSLAIVSGAACYLVAGALIVATDGALSLSSVPLITARLLHGTGAAVIFPAALALTAAASSRIRLGMSLAITSAGQNLAQAVFPALSLIVLASLSIAAVAWVGALGVLLSLVLVASHRVPTRAATDFRGIWWFRMERAWARPLAGLFLVTVQWGVIQAFLPQRVIVAGGEPAIYFLASGLSILVMRLPVGRLVEHVAADRLTRLGGLLLALSGLLLTIVRSGPLLPVAGALGGAGAAIAITPLVVELGRTSRPGSSGSAFSLMSFAMAASLTVGSVVGGPIISTLGFELTIILAAITVLLGGFIAAKPASTTGPALA